MAAVRINLDPLARALDAAADHPLAHLARQLVPDAMAKVDAVRANLPDVVAGVQAQATAELEGEVRALERRAVRAIGGFLDEALTRAGKRAPRAKRLRAGKKK